MSKKFLIKLLTIAFLGSVFSFTSSIAEAQNCVPCSPSQWEYIDPCAATCAPQFGYDDPCYNYSGFGFGRFGIGGVGITPHVFYGRVESVFWKLDDADSRPLILQNVITPTALVNQPIFSGDAIDYSVNGAPRVVLGLNITPFTAIEGQYTGFHHLRKNYFFEGPNGLSLPGDLGTTNDFFLVPAMDVFSETDMHSAEINLVKRTRVPYISWLAGFRYFNFEEKFELHSVQNINTPVAPSADYRIRTHNDLYGGQLGVKAELPLTERLGVQFLGKAGVYNNRARQSNKIVSHAVGPAVTTVTRDAQGTLNKTSFLGELNLGGYIKITENVQIVAGYNVMWVNNLARAFDQMDFTFTANSGASVRTDSVLLHGANVGVEMRF